MTCHDGFTLNDLVSYNSKHNEANKEENRDGTDDNNSFNFGEEERQRSDSTRSTNKTDEEFPLHTLSFPGSSDDVGWRRDPQHTAGEQQRVLSGQRDKLVQLEPRPIVRKIMLDFTTRLISFRKEHPILRRRRFFQGRKLFGASKDITWLQPNGQEMTDQALE